MQFECAGEDNLLFVLYDVEHPINVEATVRSNREDWRSWAGCSGQMAHGVFLKSTTVAYMAEETCINEY